MSVTMLMRESELKHKREHQRSKDKPHLSLTCFLCMGNLKKNQAQSNKHRKVKHEHLQDFQHGEGCFPYMKISITVFPSLIIIFISIMNKLNNITITQSMLFMIY